MRLAESTTLLATRTAAHPGPRPTFNRRAGRRADVGPDQLRRWLCDPAAPVPSLGDMASAFGLCFDSMTGAYGDAPPPHLLRFTLAVLHDTFPTDGAIRRWLRAPSAELSGQRPLDLLLCGDIEQLEELAVREWNRLFSSGPGI